MYYTVKTLLETGKSISKVARELGIDRKTRLVGSVHSFVSGYIY